MDQLRGSGGTLMVEGIKAALSYPPDGKRLRIVMFLTDGYIGNENQILTAVRDLIGAARLFSFGVGRSVNRFLLDEMAREGRGDGFLLDGGRPVKAEGLEVALEVGVQAEGRKGTGNRVRPVLVPAG